MDKEAGPLAWLINRALRSKHSPLSSYHVDMARRGLQAGFEGTGRTIAPRTGTLLMSTLGPSSGLLDNYVGQGLGMEVRHGLLHQAGKVHPNLETALARPGLLKLPHAAELLQGNIPFTNLPISKNNQRRLKKLHGGVIQPVAGTPLAALQEAVQKGQHNAPPLLRNLAQALTTDRSSPMAKLVDRGLGSQTPARQQGRMLVGGEFAQAALPALLRGDVPGAIAHGLGHAAMALPEATLAGMAERGKVQTLMALKTRTVANMADPKAGPTAAIGRMAQRAYGIGIDPAVDEFTRVGDYLNKARKAGHNALDSAPAKLSALPTQLPVANAVEPLRGKLRSATDKLNQAGSVSAVGAGLKKDFGPALAAAKGMFGKTAAEHHHAKAVVVKKREHEILVCPHCGDEIREKSIYSDVKGWTFHRPCFAKGKGAIKLPPTDWSKISPQWQFLRGHTKEAEQPAATPTGSILGKLKNLKPATVALAGTVAGLGGMLYSNVFPSVDRSKLVKMTDHSPERQKELTRKARTFSNALEGRGTLASTYHHRVVVPKSYLTQQDLTDLGYLPSKIAVPEAGQDQWTSYRHPDNLFHFHSHPNAWTVHKDEHPSLAMLKYREATPLARLKGIGDGLKHVAMEGVPGYYAYLRNKLTGGSDGLPTGSRMTSAILGENHKAVVRPDLLDPASKGYRRNMANSVAKYGEPQVKEAAPRWIKEWHNLSPENQQRAAGTMRPGRFRELGDMGVGSFNLATHGIGNVGGYAGEMVRKLPRQQDDFTQNYGDVMHASNTLEKVAPGLHAQYLGMNADPSRGSVGLFQHVANKDAIPGFRGATEQRQKQLANNATSPAIQAGFSDLGARNLGPGGQAYDFQYHNPATGKLVGDATSDRNILPGETLPHMKDKAKQVEPAGREFMQTASPSLIEGMRADPFDGSQHMLGTGRDQASAIKRHWLGPETPLEAVVPAARATAPLLPSFMSAPKAEPKAPGIWSRLTGLFGGRTKQGYSGALGSGAEGGQSSTIPPRLMDASGATPAGPENQPASFKSPRTAYLDFLESPLDEAMFDMGAIKAAVDTFDLMPDEEAESSRDMGSADAHGMPQPRSRSILATLGEPPPYQESGALGAQGATQAPGGYDFNPSDLGAPGSAPATMALDSTTADTGPLPHLNA